MKSYIKAHPCPPPLNLFTLPPTLLYHRVLPWCRKRFRKPPPRDEDPPESASTEGRGAGLAARWGANRKVKPAAGGGGGGGPGGGGGGGGLPGGGPGGRRDSFKKSATSFAAEMDRAETDLFAAWTFTAAKAQAVEERARRALAWP